MRTLDEYKAGAAGVRFLLHDGVLIVSEPGKPDRAATLRDKYEWPGAYKYFQGLNPDVDPFPEPKPAEPKGDAEVGRAEPQETR